MTTTPTIDESEIEGKPTAAQLKAARKKFPGLRGKALEQAALGRSPKQQREDAKRGLAMAAAASAAAAKKRKGGKISVYDDEIRAAGRVVREVLDGKGCPGAKQIALVRKTIGKNTDPVKASGLSARRLKEYATGKWNPERGSSASEELVAIAKKAGDPWCRSRRLAAILHGLATARAAK